jgi:hypothetical protein
LAGGGTLRPNGRGRAGSCKHMPSHLDREDQQPSHPLFSRLAHTMRKRPPLNPRLHMRGSPTQKHGACPRWLYLPAVLILSVSPSPDVPLALPDVEEKRRIYACAHRTPRLPSSTVLLCQLLLQPPVLADDVRKVVDLTSANFSSAVDGSRFTIVNFYAGGHSSPSFALTPSRGGMGHALSP